MYSLGKNLPRWRHKNAKYFLAAFVDDTAILFGTGITTLMRRIGRTYGWFFGFSVGWLVAVAPLAAQESDHHFAAPISRRLVHQFDFEEAKFNNFEDLPMYWYAMGRPALTPDRTFMRYPIHEQLVSRSDFPAYTVVEFDRPQSESGQHRLHLKIHVR